MSIKDLTITDQTVQGIYVQSQPDRLTGTAQQNKAVFDAYPAMIRQKFNELIALLTATGAAGEIPITVIEGVSAENVQQALSSIQQNLTAYINKIKAETGAAEVGVSTIGGMTAQNVQKALEELRIAIDNIVSGIIPGGSITPDMIAGPIPPEQGGTGATTAQAALAALGAGVRPNLMDNSIFVGGGTVGNLPVNQKQQSSYTGAVRWFDRWFGIDSTCSCVLQSDGILLASDQGWCMYAILSDDIKDAIRGKTVTASVLSEVGLDFFIIENALSADDAKDFSSGVSLWLDPQGNFKLGVQQSAKKIYAVKLELGNGQTLAWQDTDATWKLLPQPDSDYATLLLRCQQYYIEYNLYNVRYPAYVNGAVGYSTVQTPTQMAKKPVFQLLGVEYGILYGATSVPNGASVTEMSANSVVIQLNFPAEAGVMSANWGQCYFALDTGM